MTIGRSDTIRLFFLAGVMPLALLLTSCATTTPSGSHLVPLQGLAPVPVPDFEFHAVSQEMKRFLDRYTDPEMSPDRKAWSLVWATTDRNVLNFEYDPALTLNSVETFAQGKGNCLSFSSMLVAMARSIGLKATYQEVEIPPQWEAVNDTLLVSLHVNVIITGRMDEWVVDISGRGNASGKKVKRISDAEALAQYYNNRGADALTEGDLPLAYAYITKAIATDSRLPYLWSNLAVVYSRNGQSQDAKNGYLTALKLDPGNGIAASNLYLIFEAEGQIELAANLRRKVERHRRKNPYYLYHLSAMAFEEGRYDESREMLLRAIGMKEQEYRFHYDLARSLAQEGDRAAAQASLQRAQQLAPDGSPINALEVDNLPALP